MESKKSPIIIQLSPQDILNLRRRFEKLSEITSFNQDIDFSAKIASYGIFREVGTVNDELARFIFDADTGLPVPRTSLVANLITWNNLSGVCITSSKTQRLELRTPAFYDVVHPTLSANADGTLHSLYIFPEIIQHITAQHGVNLVLVKSWGLNSMFGGFDPKKEYYQTNFWELENNDSLKFADLIRRGQLTLMGTHDLIAHVAGVQKEAWLPLKQKADDVYKTITEYFKTCQKPSISALVLPYTIGVILDDLAQPPTYNSKGHIAVIDALLKKLKHLAIKPQDPLILTEFPKSFQKIIEMSRTKGIENKTQDIEFAVHTMAQQILEKSFVINKSG